VLTHVAVRDQTAQWTKRKYCADGCGCYLTWVGSSDSAPRLYALVVGIDTYPHISQLTGAVHDANLMTAFLTEHLSVPPNQIINLRNDEATRTAILHTIDGFRSNADIQQGDPILIYFAGHGGKRKAGPEWRERNGSDYIQVIFPWDYDANMVPEPEKPIHPIPDRTIRGLINKLAKAKGDNIVR
jgi:hypothetical protein